MRCLSERLAKSIQSAGLIKSEKPRRVAGMGVNSGVWEVQTGCFFGVWLEEGSAFAANRHCPVPRTALRIVNAFFWTSQLQKGRAPASRNSLPYAPEVALAQRKYCGSALASGSTARGLGVNRDRACAANQLSKGVAP